MITLPATAAAVVECVQEAVVGAFTFKALSN
jgi:hypothetical protein